MEIIKRIRINETTLNVTRSSIQGRLQTSFNSDGCLILRFVDGLSDYLLVLDRGPSEELIDFVQNRLRKSMRQTSQADQDIPF